MDHRLYTETGPEGDIVLWQPQIVSTVVLEESDYRPFTQVTPTVLLREALRINAKKRKTPTLDCADHYINRQILMLRAKLDEEDEDEYDWQGHVRFNIPINVVMRLWKNFYLKDIVQEATHIKTHILVTNSDHSSVLHPYHPRASHGSWRLTSAGRHECLINCRGYNSFNKQRHTLELMIEATRNEISQMLYHATSSVRNSHLVNITNLISEIFSGTYYS